MGLFVVQIIAARTIESNSESTIQKQPNVQTTEYNKHTCLPQKTFSAEWMAVVDDVVTTDGLTFDITGSGFGASADDNTVHPQANSQKQKQTENIFKIGTNIKTNKKTKGNTTKSNDKKSMSSLPPGDNRISSLHSKLRRRQRHHLHISHPAYRRLQCRFRLGRGQGLRLPLHF